MDKKLGHWVLVSKTFELLGRSRFLSSVFLDFKIKLMNPIIAQQFPLKGKSVATV